MSLGTYQAPLHKAYSFHPILKLTLQPFVIVIGVGVPLKEGPLLAIAFYWEGLLSFGNRRSNQLLLDPQQRLSTGHLL